MIKITVGPIYKSIWIYRAIMYVLYHGKYSKRFTDICSVLDKNDRSIVELCFGDIVIAEYCRKNQIAWVGYDISRAFVEYAIRKGYNAIEADILDLEALPQADVCIMAGSLYHFYGAIDRLWPLMLSSSKKIILSEPVKNLTSIKGAIGAISGYLSNAGKGNENFRYTHDTFLAMLNTCGVRFKFSFRIVSEGKEILVRITHGRDEHSHSRI